MLKVDKLECITSQNCADVISITKSWLSEEIPDAAIGMRDFILFQNNCGSRGGGVVVCVNSGIPCRRLLALEPIDLISEILWIQLRPRRLSRPVSVILFRIVYHPPHTSAKDNNNLYNHVQKTVDLFMLSHPESLVCVVGDFTPNSTKVSPATFKHMCGQWKIVKVLTRDTGTLDWCLTSTPKIFADPVQLPKIGTSDHFGVIIHYCHTQLKPTKCTISTHDMRNCRIQEFGQWITTHNWNYMYALDMCNAKADYFNRTLQSAMEKFLPFKCSCVHNKDRLWITLKIKAWIKMRQKRLATHGKDSAIFKM